MFRLAHLDRICAEKDFSTVDDPIKELRKLQNDPSLIKTNSLIKRTCNENTLNYLFDIIKYYMKKLLNYKPQQPILKSNNTTSNKITSPRPPMPQISEENDEKDENKEDNDDIEIEHEETNITYAYFILSCLRLLRSKVRIAALIYKEDKEEYDKYVGSFNFNELQKSVLQFMGESSNETNDSDNNDEIISKLLENIDKRIHRLIQYEATALLSAGIELFYPSHSSRIELVNTLLDGSSSSIFTQALLAQFSQPALLQDSYLQWLLLMMGVIIKKKPNYLK